MKKDIIIIGGPTASGKTSLSIEVARQLDAVIINADSQQVYQDIPIITAQPTKEEQENIPHKLYSVISVMEFFSVAKWLKMAQQEISSALQQDKTPILVGGTGMYIKALIDGISDVPDIDADLRANLRNAAAEKGTEFIYEKLQTKDPDVAKTLNAKDTQRVLRAYEVLQQTGKSISYWHSKVQEPIFPKEQIKLYFLLPKRQKLYENCNKRFLQMVENGVLDEMKKIDQMQVPNGMPAMRAHGLRELILYLNDKMSLEDAIAISQQNTRKYIKRQTTWFRHQMSKPTLQNIGDITAGDILSNIQT